MTTPLNIRHQLYRSPTAIPDPGSAGTITIDRDGGICSVVTAGAEARTLRQPTKAGVVGTVCLDTDGGDLTLTVTGGYNNDDDTSLTFDDAGDYVRFLSVKVGTSYLWRVVGSEGVIVASGDQVAHIADPADPAALTATLVGVDTGTDMTAAQAATIVADLGALRTAILANNAAIDSILVALETSGLVASA